MTEIRRETRTVSGDLQLRSVDGVDGFTFEGYAAVWDTSYDVHDSMGTYRETFRPGAFTRALQVGADVRMLVNHTGMPLARTTSGTMQLREDDYGLLVRAQLDPANPKAQEVRSVMARGDANQMSHQFSATRQKWDSTYENREVLQANLCDVSIVSFPANDATVASMRTDTADVVRACTIMASAERQLRAGSLDDATRTLLLQIIGAIDAGTEAIEDATEMLEQIAGGVEDVADYDDMSDALEDDDVVATDASQGDSGIPMRSAWLTLRAEALNL